MSYFFLIIIIPKCNNIKGYLNFYAIKNVNCNFSQNYFENHSFKNMKQNILKKKFEFLNSAKVFRLISVTY